MDTDSQVFQDIVDEFKNSPVLHYAQLGLHVENGVVTISGRVNSFAERKAVERAAKRVTGIKTLILEIRAAVIPITVTVSDAGTQKDTARKDCG
jgi:osmotically-inducible protein OsmY